MALSSYTARTGSPVIKRQGGCTVGGVIRTDNNEHAELLLAFGDVVREVTDARAAQPAVLAASSDSAYSGAFSK
jgi:uncharacterized membrane protein